MLNIPLLQGYDEKEVLVSPKQQIDNFIRNHKAKLGRLPPDCILAAMNPVRIENALIKEKWVLKKEFKFIPKSNEFPLKIYEKNKKKIVFAYGEGVGPSALCNKLELLIYLGVKRVYMIGMCGGIQKVNIGDIIIATKAIRDEGISYHYLEKSTEAKASEFLLKEFKGKFKAIHGIIWTTDTMYRETVSKYKNYKNKGVLGIDMETASAYVVAQYRNINIISCMVVSDIIKVGEWNPQFHSKVIDVGVSKIIKGITLEQQ